MADILGSPTTANFSNTAMQIGGNQAFPIVQIVTVNSASATTTTSSTPQATNLTTSFTAKFSSSKLLVLVSGNLESDATGAGATITLFKDSTDLAPGASGFAGLSIAVTGLTGANVGVAFHAYLNATDTSSHTYVVKLFSQNNVATVKFGNGGEQTMTIIEIAQ